ncbi:hypothetical protein THAOC_21434 [Thalassiosira oceanica]|uniref:Uncharacterized protein n=1 Tax=Thalassiosira oceanica TaxID=159749 RepID=K0RXB9_THAOC|nr:hypothetical protein THAOC_21434 [Thalassiosira oceanica]|eukprot:EJK58433.1 hypothetical protein THAOC_21434 [Thalassiosira oceanica]
MDAIKVRKGDAKQAGGASSQSVAARRTTNNKEQTSQKFKHHTCLCMSYATERGHGDTRHKQTRMRGELKNNMLQGIMQHNATKHVIATLTHPHYPSFLSYIGISPLLS